MTIEQPQTASDLRARFKAIPADQRDANQAFSVRVWRGLSWLERSESAGDVEGRFISLWIAFNAIYGHLSDEGLNAPDRSSWQEFLASIVKFDGADRLGAIMRREQLHVLRLVDNQYLFRPFWGGQKDAPERLKRLRRRVILHLQEASAVGVFEELFERLYVLRQQVFHGAATVQSKLNRSYLKAATQLLSWIIPAMVEIIIEAGPERDWGEVCFPPVKNRGH